MSLHECPRESDVLDAIASARWPHRVDRELADHVAACAVCGDVAVVADAMRADRQAAWQDAVVPPSGQVWWRAEMRARQEAVRAASRPITVASGIAAVLTVALSIAAIGFAWPSIRRYVSSIEIANGQMMGSPFALPLLVALGALVVLTPLALYLVLSDE